MIVSYPTAEGVTIAVHSAPSDEDVIAAEALNTKVDRTKEYFTELAFRRTAIGLSIAEPPFNVVIVGERYFEYEDQMERIYVVLDEAEFRTAHSLGMALIDFKDRYHISTVYCPNHPLSTYEALRNTDGLSHYRNDSDPMQIAKTKWPSYISYDRVASIQAEETPSDATVHREIEQFLSADAINPKTQKLLMAADGEPTPKLLFPNDLTNRNILMAVRRADIQPSIALYHALHGLESSGGWSPAVRKIMEKAKKPQGNNPGGY